MSLTVGFYNETKNWKLLYERICKWFGRSFNLQLNPPRCDVFFCSYDDVHRAIRSYPNSLIVFISGEPKPVPSSPRISIILDCKKIPQFNYSFSSVMFIPFYAYSFLERRINTPQALIKPSNPLTARKSKFCAFMYRYDIPHRVRLFDELSKYKSVTPLGKSRNPNRAYNMDGNPYDDAVTKYKDFKFVICCENTIIPGYVTEKIVNAMLAGAIPIYLGAPDIGNYFNPKSFINVSSFNTTQSMVEYVKKIDQDDDLYKSMLHEPWLYNNKIESFLRIDDKLRDFAALIKSKIGSNSSHRYILTRGRKVQKVSRFSKRIKHIKSIQRIRRIPFFRSRIGLIKRRPRQLRSILLRRRRITRV